MGTRSSNQSRDTLLLLPHGTWRQVPTLSLDLPFRHWTCQFYYRAPFVPTRLPLKIPQDSLWLRAEPALRGNCLAFSAPPLRVPLLGQTAGLLGAHPWAHLLLTLGLEAAALPRELVSSQHSHEREWGPGDSPGPSWPI